MVYAIVALILTVRFFKNLYAIHSISKNNKSQIIENEKVISMDFQSEKKDTFLLPDDFKPSGVLLNQQIILLVDNSQIRIYQRKNTPLKDQ